MKALPVSWEIRDDIHEAFMTFATAIICWRRLVPLIMNLAPTARLGRGDVDVCFLPASLYRCFLRLVREN